MNDLHMTDKMHSRCSSRLHVNEGDAANLQNIKAGSKTRWLVCKSACHVSAHMPSLPGQSSDLLPDR
jgi:hypothetical protein